jgi:hypothetical protein
MLYLVWHFFVNDTITLIYVTVMIVLPLLFVIFKLIKSREKKQLHSASRIMKIVMLTGLLYSVVVKVLIVAKVLLTWTLF